MTELAALCRRWAFVLLLAFAAATGAVPAGAQVTQIDPNAGIDGDLAPLPSSQSSPQSSSAPPAYEPTPSIDTAPVYAEPVVTSGDNSTAASQASDQPAAAAAQGDTYKEDDLIGAAEGVFGKGAEGLARLIEDILKKQGEPNGYIVGREGGGALFLGARYGSGTLYHKVEGQKPVYWRGPSLGVDLGANAANTFVLVYNLFDSEDLFKTFGAAEGQAYLIGGFNVSYLRKGDVVLIPVRAGAGLRLGLNVGYMKFSKKQKWVPF